MGQQRQGQEEEAEGAGEEAEGRGEEEDPERRGEVGARGPDPRAEGEAGGEEGGVRAWQLLNQQLLRRESLSQAMRFLADRTTDARSARRDCPSPGRARKPLWRVAFGVFGLQCPSIAISPTRKRRILPRRGPPRPA